MDLIVPICVCFVVCVRNIKRRIPKREIRKIVF